MELDDYEKEALKNKSIRKYKVQKLNFDASKYFELFSWETTKLHEPSLTQHLTDDQLLAIIGTPLIVRPFPCHTQAVERTIRVMTESASAVIGQEARDGWIRQTIKSRKELG